MFKKISKRVKTLGALLMAISSISSIFTPKPTPEETKKQIEKIIGKPRATNRTIHPSRKQNHFLRVRTTDRRH